MLGGWLLLGQGRSDEQSHVAALPHLHGLGYSADGSQFVAAARVSDDPLDLLWSCDGKVAIGPL